MPENTDLNLARILLALDAWGCSEASLRRVISLASHIKAQIHGLYIEDSDLLQLAELPFTREVSLNTAQARNLSSATLNRHLRSYAGEIKLLLEEQTRLAAIYFTFKTVRGQRIPVILQESRNANIIIIPGSPASHLPISRDNGHLTIAAIYSGSPQSRNTLPLAISLAEKEHGQLIVFCNSEEARQQAQQDLQISHIDSLLKTYSDDSDLSGYLRRIKPKTVIFSEGDPLIASAEQIKKLLQTVKCDLIITRQVQV